MPDHLPSDEAKCKAAWPGAFLRPERYTRGRRCWWVVKADGRQVTWGHSVAEAWRNAADRLDPPTIEETKPRRIFPHHPERFLEGP